MRRRVRNETTRNDSKTSSLISALVDSQQIAQNQVQPRVAGSAVASTSGSFVSASASAAPKTPGPPLAGSVSFQPQSRAAHDTFTTHSGNRYDNDADSHLPAAAEWRKSEREPGAGAGGGDDEVGPSSVRPVASSQARGINAGTVGTLRGGAQQKYGSTKGWRKHNDDDGGGGGGGTRRLNASAPQPRGTASVSTTYGYTRTAARIHTRRGNDKDNDISADSVSAELSKERPGGTQGQSVAAEERDYLRAGIEDMIARLKRDDEALRREMNMLSCRYALPKGEPLSQQHSLEEENGSCVNLRDYSRNETAGGSGSASSSSLSVLQERRQQELDEDENLAPPSTEEDDCAIYEDNEGISESDGDAKIRDHLEEYYARHPSKRRPNPSARVRRSAPLKTSSSSSSSSRARAEFEEAAHVVPTASRQDCEALPHRTRGASPPPADTDARRPVAHHEFFSGASERFGASSSSSSTAASKERLVPAVAAESRVPGSTRANEHHQRRGDLQDAAVRGGRSEPFYIPTPFDDNKGGGLPAGVDMTNCHNSRIPSPRRVVAGSTSTTSPTRLAAFEASFVSLSKKMEYSNDGRSLSDTKEYRCFVPKEYEGPHPNCLRVSVAKEKACVTDLVREIRPQLSNGPLAAKKLTLCLRTHESGTPIWLCDTEVIDQVLADWKAVSDGGPDWPRLYVQVM
ncbi:unnamed protein product [Amoebophrya sp. A25]|nr:unnamed protein product [Amoebophrya sp. A25]|eukprot:GSA25T00001103001.1